MGICLGPFALAHFKVFGARDAALASSNRSDGISSLRRGHPGEVFDGTRLSRRWAVPPS